MIPPTQVCMGCHAMVKTDSARLAPVRASWESGKPVEWVQVHKLPDHAYFDHSAHLAAGVGCVTCHGRIDQMEVVRADTAAQHGLVPRMSPRSEAEPPAEGSDHQHGVEAGDGSRVGPRRTCIRRSIARGVTDEPPSNRMMFHAAARRREGLLEEPRRQGRAPTRAQKRAEIEVAAASAAAEAIAAREASPQQGGRSARRFARRDVSIGRRGFMFFAGAIAALAAEGCARRPVEKIMPYSKAPEHVLPGVANHYATVRQYRSDAIGILVESHEGRPTKIEGNDKHPSSNGATDLWTQAAIFELYDPDRSTTPMRKAAPSRAVAPGVHAAVALPSRRGASSTPSSPTSLARRRPTAARSSASSSSPPTRRRSSASATRSPRSSRRRRSTRGRPSTTRTRAKARSSRSVRSSPSPADYSQAKVILSLDSDFLGTETGNIRANREFAARSQARERLERSDEPALRRRADLHGHRHERRSPPPSPGAGRRAVPPRAREGARATSTAIDLGGIAQALGEGDARGRPRQVDPGRREGARRRPRQERPRRRHASARARSRARARAQRRARQRRPHGQLLPAGRSLRAPIPSRASRRSSTTWRRAPSARSSSSAATPSTTRRPTSSSASASARSARRVHLSSHFNETSEACVWHAPRAHELEAWGDQTVARRHRRHPAAAHRAALRRPERHRDPREALRRHRAEGLRPRAADGARLALEPRRR